MSDGQILIAILALSILISSISFHLGYRIGRKGVLTWMKLVQDWQTIAKRFEECANRNEKTAAMWKENSDGYKALYINLAKETSNAQNLPRD